jgi:hypothetical protein
MRSVSGGQVASVCRNEPSEDRATALESRSKSGKRNKENDDQVITMGLFNFAIRRFWEQAPLWRLCSGGCGCWNHYRHQISLPHLHWMNALIPGILCRSRADTSRGKTWGICARTSRQEYIRGRKTRVNSLLRNLLAPCHTLQSRCGVYFALFSWFVMRNFHWGWRST